MKSARTCPTQSSLNPTPREHQGIQVLLSRAGRAWVEYIELLRIQVGPIRIGTELIHAQQFADGIKATLERRTTHVVQRAYAALSLLRSHSENGWVRDVGHDSLSANMTETPATFGISVGRWR